MTDNDAQLESAAIPLISWLNSIGDMSGIGTSPASSTTPPPSSSSTSSPQPTSSSSSSIASSTSTSSLTAVPPPAEPTAQLILAYGSECDEGAISCDSDWLFYEPSVGSTYDVCDDVAQTTAPTDISLNNVPYPSGTFNLNFKVNGVSGCTYTGTSDAPGTLDCPDFTLPQECEEDSQDTDVISCYLDQGVLQVVPKVYCAWD